MTNQLNPLTDNDLILMGFREFEIPTFWAMFHKAYKAAGSAAPPIEQAAREMAQIYLKERTATAIKDQQQRNMRSPNHQANHPAIRKRR